MGISAIIHIYIYIYIYICIYTQVWWGCELLFTEKKKAHQKDYIYRFPVFNFPQPGSYSIRFRVFSDRNSKCNVVTCRFLVESTRSVKKNALLPYESLNTLTMFHRQYNNRNHQQHRYYNREMKKKGTKRNLVEEKRNKERGKKKKKKNGDDGDRDNKYWYYEEVEEEEEGEDEEEDDEMLEDLVEVQKFDVDIELDREVEKS